MMNYGQQPQMFNQFVPQMQRLQQMEMQQPQDRVMRVVDENAARNIQVDMMNGTTTYCVYGDTILARNWNVAEGRVVCKTFKLQDDTTLPQENKVTLNDILDRLDEINKKVTPSKKVAKDVE